MSSSEAEREIEDMFNAEVFGIDTSDNGVTPIPESKPVIETEAVEETHETPAQEEVEADPAEPGAEDDTEAEAEAPEAPEQEAGEEVEEEVEEYVAWAKKKFGEDTDLSSDTAQKLAKSAYEQEKMIGKQAAETKAAREAAERAELQAKIDALQTPGSLTPEEDSWVDEALGSGDPAEWAYNALQAERPDLYATILNRWSSMGEQEAMLARRFDAQVIQTISAPQPSQEESYSMALGQTFQSLGLNVEQHGPIVLAKAEELGASHPAVAAMMSPDPTIRQLGTRNVYDLAVQGKTTVRKAVVTDEVDARVKEEQLRAKAAGVTTGKPHVEQPKKSPFWEGFDAELSERGWDGNSPTYGRD